MLSDEQNSIGIIQCEHARREIGEVDDAVDPWGAIWSGDLVMPDRDPCVLVRDPSRSP
jgi:regulator of RNase E activity RraA